MMNLRKIRSYMRLASSLLFGVLYMPHLILGGGNTLIFSDLSTLEGQIGLKLPKLLQIIYHLHNNRYYRNLFYYRIGPVKASFLKWYCPEDRYFSICATTKIGASMWIAHPYATILNADSIGSNFRCIHCTTIGAYKGRPTIGDNVELGANVTIIGNIHIGNNVTVGAGAVVVKDIPDNCIIAGNPAKIIKIKSIPKA